MGLLSRIGKNLGRTAVDQYGDESATRQFMNYMSPAMGAVMGAPAGALTDISMNGGDGSAGGQIGMLAGGLMGGALGSRKLIMAIAQALKQKAPQVADAEVIQQAQKMATAMQSNPAARAQVEQILGPMDWGQ